MVDYQYFASTRVEDKNWLWHYRYGHLNFRSLSMSNKKQMMYGLPHIKEKILMCEEFCRAKQVRKSFKHDLPMKAKKRLELVHSDVYRHFKVRSNEGNCYFLTFLYYFTRHIWIYIIKKRAKCSNSSRDLSCMSKNKVTATLKN